MESIRLEKIARNLAKKGATIEVIAELTTGLPESEIRRILQNASEQ
jgi:hypothetical protein